MTDVCDVSALSCLTQLVAGYSLAVYGCKRW